MGTGLGCVRACSTTTGRADNPRRLDRDDLLPRHCPRPEIELGALEPVARSSGSSYIGVRGHLNRQPRESPGDLYVLRPGREHLRCVTGADLILRKQAKRMVTGAMTGMSSTNEKRLRRERRDVMAPRVGYEAQPGDGPGAQKVSGKREARRAFAGMRRTRAVGSAVVDWMTRARSRSKEPRGRNGRRGISRDALGGTAQNGRPRRLDSAAARLRPHALGRRRALVRRRAAGVVIHLAGRGRRHRRQPRQPRAGSSTRT